MSELKFTKPTDQENEIVLDSYLISAEWTQSIAYVGQRVFFEVYTSFVGQGAPITITPKSEKGQSLDVINDFIEDDFYRGEIKLNDYFEPYDPIFFDVELKDNSLWGQSAPIQVFPRPVVRNLKWSKDEAHRGDVLTLSAEITNVPKKTRVSFVIYKYDPFGAHERIAEIPKIIEKPNVSVKWQYLYHGDRYKVPTYPQIEKYCGMYEDPRYFFVIKIGNKEYGHDDRPFIKIVLEWATLNVKFNDLRKDIAVQAIGPEKRVGLTDDDGFVSFENLKPGAYDVSICPDQIIRLRLHDPKQLPMPYTPFLASWSDGKYKGFSDDKAWANIAKPGDKEIDTLKIEWGGEDHGEYEYKSEIKLNCTGGDESVMAKLHNLGYHESDFSLDEAVCQFQFDYGIFDEMGLTGEGTLPPKTKKELARIYGNKCDAMPKSRTKQ